METGDNLVTQPNKKNDSNTLKESVAVNDELLEQKTLSLKNKIPEK